MLMKTSHPQKSEIEERMDSCKYLVIKLVNRFGYPRDAEYDCMMSDANFGLLKAARNYNPDYKVKFVTYAYKCIVSQIIDGRRRRRKKSPITHSLDTPISGDRTLEDVLVVFDEDPADILDTKHFWSVVNQALNPREIEILRKRSNGIKLKELAKEQGCTRQRIQQIEKQAKNKVKYYILEHHRDIINK